MKKTLLALAATLALVGSPVAAAPATASTTPHHASYDARHACTRTSSGHCIRGGEFCPRSKWHQSGWDAKGRRYVCKGNYSHPHWMKP